VKYHNVFTPDPENPNLISIQTVPKLAIGQRAFLCLDENGPGNVLWDCITYLDDETIRHINSLGGIRAIVISHPHYFSTSIQWADVFNCDLYISAEDEEWVANRGDGHRLKLWKGQRLSLPSPPAEISDFVAIKTGGHFPGSSVLWWKSARKLLIADTIMIVPSGLYRVNRRPGTVSYAFMWSYPNYVCVLSTVSDIYQSTNQGRFRFPRMMCMGFGKQSRISISRTPMVPLPGRTLEVTVNRGFWRAQKLSFAPRGTRIILYFMGKSRLESFRRVFGRVYNGQQEDKMRLILC
jgi:hypothetical protein